MEDLRFPVGKFHYDGSPSPQQKQVFLDEIAQTPTKLRGAVAGLAEATGHSVSPGRMDRAAGGPPCSGQPLELLHAIQTCIDGR